MNDIKQHLQVRAPAPDWFHRAIKQQPESRHVNVEGCPIHYLLWQPLKGVENPAGLLFLHGGGAHAYWWGHIAPFFRANFRVAAMDISGMGDSGKRAEYNATIRTEEIHAVMCFAFTNEIPKTIKELDLLSKDAFLQSAQRLSLIHI